MSTPYPLHRTDANPSRLRHRRTGPVTGRLGRAGQRQGDHSFSRLRAQRRNTRPPGLVPPKFLRRRGPNPCVARRRLRRKGCILPRCGRRCRAAWPRHRRSVLLSTAWRSSVAMPDRARGGQCFFIGMKQPCILGLSSTAGVLGAGSKPLRQGAVNSRWNILNDAGCRGGHPSRTLDAAGQRSGRLLYWRSVSRNVERSVELFRCD
jgi:hypothetical protein